MPQENERPTRPPFQSALKEGHQRFLAHVIEHSLSCGRRTPEDFVRHFTPRTIMKGLEHEAALRANILVQTTGLKQKIALKKEWEDATVDLQIALDEGETDAAAIVALFHPDDRVRFLEPQQLWAFISEGEFWKSASVSKLSADVARSHIAFMLERAFEDKLITHRDLVEGATVEELANRLPKSELGRLIMHALQNADRGMSFTEADLIATTPPRTLVQYVPLAHLWESVIMPKIAERHGYHPPATPEAAPVASAESATTPKLPVVSSGTEQASKPAAEVSLRSAEVPAKEPANSFGTQAVGASLKAKEAPKPRLKQPESSAGVSKPSAAAPVSDLDDIVITDDDLKTG